jgi:catechol 2,3-dioxygenase-like lactoylglutathione lyase family enzyme
MVPARLNVVTLGARDLARLRSFYSALGWEVAIEAEDFCAFRLRGALLALFPREKLAADGQAQAAAPARGMRGFSLGINVDRPEQVDEAIAAVETAGGTVTKPPSAPAEFEGRHAYFADPEENYWEVVYLSGDGPGQQAIAQALGELSRCMLVLAGLIRAWLNKKVSRLRATLARPPASC